MVLEAELCRGLDTQLCLETLKSVTYDGYILGYALIVFGLSFIIVLTLGVFKRVGKGRQRLITKPIFWSIWLLSYWLVFILLLFTPYAGAFVLKRIFGG